jgi:hypothetical protein
VHNQDADRCHAPKPVERAIAPPLTAGHVMITSQLRHGFLPLVANTAATSWPDQARKAIEKTLSRHMQNPEKSLGLGNSVIAPEDVPSPGIDAVCL